MKPKPIRRSLCLASLALALAVGALPVCAQAPTELPAVPGYTMVSCTEERDGAAVLRYVGEEQQAFTVYYRPGEYVRADEEKLQAYFAPLLYRYYSVAATEDTVDNAVFGMEGLTVRIAAPGSTPDEMLALVDLVQQSGAPLASLPCGACGQDTLRYTGTQTGPWENEQAVDCGHGGINRYADVFRTRTLTKGYLCESCGAEVEKQYEQQITFCGMEQKEYYHGICRETE